MSGFATYDELTESLADWVHRSGETELVARIPDFIRLAEVRIEREIDWPLNELSKTGTFTAGSSELALPGDFSWPLQLAITTEPQSTLEIVSLYKLETVRAIDSPARPLYAALVGKASGLTYQLSPTPDSGYAYLLRYMGGLAKLSAESQTNWLLASGPDAYLYGSLLAMAPFIQEDARIPLWEGFFRDAVRSLKRVAVRQRTGGGPLRVRPDRWA